jgi:hypothetical protein
MDLLNIRKNPYATKPPSLEVMRTSWCIANVGREYIGECNDFSADWLTLFPAYEWLSSVGMMPDPDPRVAPKLARQIHVFPIENRVGLLEIKLRPVSLIRFADATDKDLVHILECIQHGETLREGARVQQLGIVPATTVPKLDLRHGGRQ